LDFSLKSKLEQFIPDLDEHHLYNGKFCLIPADRQKPRAYKISSSCYAILSICAFERCNVFHTQILNKPSPSTIELMLKDTTLKNPPKFCTPNCGDAYYRDLNIEYPNRKKSGSLKKVRARLRRYGGEHIDNVTLSALFTRDHGLCKICGCDVVMSNEYRPNQASNDHVVPLSSGGDHSYANCQLVCVTCNSIKGATDRSNKEVFNRNMELHL